MPDRPRLFLLTTGGTIASRRDATTGAVATAANGQELTDLVPELGELADLHVEAFASVNSWNMTPLMMLDLATRVNRVLDQPEITAALVTHGTDTVEETAFLLDLIVASPKPVVFVVAMRNLSEPGADGPRNLLDAAKVALDPGARDRGALLVVSETIHTARHVTKMNTVNPSTFESPDHGPAGNTGGGVVRFFHSPQPRQLIPTVEIDPEVLLIKVAAGTDARQFHWAIETGYRGIVIEGSGAGNVPAAMVPGIETTIAAGLPVVLTSRCPFGFLAPVYGSGGAAGGGWDLQRLGVIFADHLPAQKARIKLMVALGLTSEIEEIRTLFSPRAP
ncbi:MAG: asparaginase [Chloroflexota bacterium]|nr:asparaginase [Chloroflexota bacterium]